MYHERNPINYKGCNAYRYSRKNIHNTREAYYSIITYSDSYKAGVILPAFFIPHMQPPIKIVKATSLLDFESAKKLFIEYQQFLQVDLCFQSFEKELRELEIMYDLPGGALLLAKAESKFVGCVAVRKKSGDTCEMKRLFVQDAYKQIGIGRILVTEIIKEAKQLGYRKIILDTLSRLKPALHLYKSLGFTETEAYYNNPLEGVVYLEKQIP